MQKSEKWSSLYHLRDEDWFYASSEQRPYDTINHVFPIRPIVIVIPKFFQNPIIKHIVSKTPKKFGVQC